MYRQAAVIGIGQTDISANSGRTEYQLALQASLAAIRDAGLEPGEIDGIVRYSYDNVDQAMMVRALGIRDLRWYSDLPFGGIATSGAIAHAAAAITAGIASTVLIYRALNERSGVRYGRAERNIAAADEIAYAAGIRTPSGQFAGPYGLLAPGQIHALWAQRYRHETGLSADQFEQVLGKVAVQQRAYANANPEAMFHDRPLTMDMYRASKMISDPLRLYDYCLETDAAAALVLTRADKARALRDDPVYVLSAHQCLYPWAEPLPVYPPMADFQAPANIRKLYQDARCEPADLSVALIYDVTTFGVVAGLETYQIAPRREGWKRILEQGIGPDSDLPVNTHGGLLSEGYIHGVNHLTEAVRQLRGQGTTQVPGAELALVGCAGWSQTIMGR